MSQDLVAQVKAALEARGAVLSGPCGAFAITQRVAWALRADGAGLLDKPGGNNCQGYATDYVVFRGGPSFDILGDGGGANTPQWNQDDDPALPARWRIPVDPGDAAAPDPPHEWPPTAGPLPTDAEVFEQNVLHALAVVSGQIEALRTQSDANTEKIQTQIHDVVKNAEASLLLLKGGSGGGGVLGQLGTLGGLGGLFRPASAAPAAPPTRARKKKVTRP